MTDTNDEVKTTNNNDGNNTAAAATTRKESEIYDRQIRLWGADAQAKISKARVLYMYMTAVNQEILKNLVLAGVRAAIYDPRPYPDAMKMTPSFFLTERTTTTTTSENNTSGEEPVAKKQKVETLTVANAIKDAVEELNPLLGECEIVSHSIGESILDIDVSKYDMVVMSRSYCNNNSNETTTTTITTEEVLAKLAKKTTEGGGKFYCVDCFGYNGICLMDLGPKYEYRAEIGKNKVSTEFYTLEPYIPLSDIFKIPLNQLKVQSRVDKKHPSLLYLQYRSYMEYYNKNKTKSFEDIVRNYVPSEYREYITDVLLAEWERTMINAEIAPVCAVLGGIMGNEVIKAISNKGEPANNCIIFEGKTGKCRNILLTTKEQQ